MTLAYPPMLWLLALPALLVLCQVLGRRRRARSWQGLAQRGRPPGLRTASMALAATLLVVALARPRFGPALGSPLPPGQDVVLLLDVSRSMAAEDAVPNRLASAVQTAMTLVDALGHDPANRVAVAAFAGRGVLRYPLTENLGAVADALTRLRPGSVQPGGTNLGGGLDAALDAFGTDEHADGRAVVVFSDGEDHADRWNSRLDRLTRMGVMVHVVLIGDDTAGHPVPSAVAGEPLIYQGQPVSSRRVDEALDAIARQTGGAIVKLGVSTTDLGALYRERIAPTARRKREATLDLERPEQFPAFLATALGFLISGCWPAGRPGPLRWLWNRATIFGLTGTMTLALLSGAAADGPPSGDVAELVGRGRTSYDDGRWSEALSDFQAALERAGDRPLLRYNAAAALFQLGRFEEASEFYRRAREQAEPALVTKIDYALGNCALSLSDFASAVEQYDRCLASTVAGAGLDAVRRDALVNRQFALEQAAATLGAEEENDDRAPKPQPRRPPSGQQGREDEGEGPQGDDDSTTGSGPGDRAQDRDGAGNSRRGRRHTGGAGGANSTPGAGGKTPDDRLDSALEEIREAQSRRLPEEDAAEPRDADSTKDW